MDQLVRGPEPQSDSDSSIDIGGRLLSTREACKILGIGRSNLGNLSRDRKIASVRIGGKLKYAEADIAEFIKQRRTPVSRLVNGSPETVTP